MLFSPRFFMRHGDISCLGAVLSLSETQSPGVELTELSQNGFKEPLIKTCYLTHDIMGEGGAVGGRVLGTELRQ